MEEIVSYLKSLPVDVMPYFEQAWVWVISQGLRILLILILALIVGRVVKAVLMRIIDRANSSSDVEHAKRIDTLGSLMRFTVSIVIWIVALIMILGELGIEIGPIIAAAGIVGLAVGFGAQRLVEDVISGFFIFLEDQIRVGDVVEIAGKGGLVEKVTLRMTILRDLAGNVHYVRNGQIDIVTNMTKEYSRYVFDVGVAYREDVDKVIEVIKEVDEEMRNDGNYAHNILEPIEILGLDKFADSAVIVRARTKTRPIKQWEVGREFNRRLKKRFDEDGIEIPFPHRTIYIGEDKAGHSPALNVHFEQDAAQQETSEDTVQQSASEDHDKPSDAPTPETDEASRMGE